MFYFLQGNENRDRWVYLLIGVVCMPYLVTFLESLFRALFGNFQRPSVGNMAWVSEYWYLILQYTWTWFIYFSNLIIIMHVIVFIMSTKFTLFQFRYSALYYALMTLIYNMFMYSQRKCSYIKIFELLLPIFQLI